jgi:hypothetical protein
MGNLSTSWRRSLLPKAHLSPIRRTVKLVKRSEKLSAKAGADFDRAYLQESGVDGHQKLEETMTKVQSKAADDTLKQLATVALPLIRVHLQAAKDEMKDKAWWEVRSRGCASVNNRHRTSSREYPLSAKGRSGGPTAGASADTRVR